MNQFEFDTESGELDQRDRPVCWAQVVCVARLSLPDPADGEHRFNLAPCEDGSWFIWGDYHAPGCETACDAAYDFAEGGAYFPTKPEAIGFLYRELSRTANEHADYFNPSLVYEI
jgi:hypothetical protein